MTSDRPFVTSDLNRPRRVLFGGLSSVQHEEARNKYLGDTKVNLTFGTRGDINLDELLQSVPVPNVDISHYYDVELEEEEDNSKSALIKKLEEMSRHYAAPASRRSPPKASTGSSATARVSNGPSLALSGHCKVSEGPRRVEFSGSTDDPGTVINFVPSSRRQTPAQTCNAGTSTSTIAALMEPPGNRQETVLLDLRPVPPPQPSTVASATTSTTPMAPAFFESSDSSSEDEEEDDGGGGLWLDRHRMARRRTGEAPTRREAWAEDGGEGRTGGVPAAPEMPPEVEAAGPEVEAAAGASLATERAAPEVEEDAPTVTTISSSAPPEETNGGVSERVQKKITEIKRREAELSKRRQLGHQLAEQLPKESVSDSRPLIFHEDESFSEPIPVLPEDEALPILTFRFEQRSPGEILTLGKRPRPIDDGRAVSGSHTALVAWLLSLTPPGSSPFRVLGFQQGGATRTGRLVTHVALHLCSPAVRGLPQLKRFLSASSLPELCPWLPKGLSLSRLPLANFFGPAEDFEWQQRLSGHFGWFLLRTDERLAAWKAGAAPDVQTSVVSLEADLLSAPSRLCRLLARAQRSGLDLAGARLLYPGGGPLLALAVRGPSAVASLCAICGPGAGAELRECRIGSWRCARFQEAVPRLLAHWFGARLPPGADAGFLRRAGPLRHCLAASQPSDMLLLASPALPEASWLIRAAMEAKMEAVGARRVRVAKNSAKDVLGMSEAQAAVFSGGACHLLVLRRENAMGHAATFVEEAFAQLREGQQQREKMPHSSLLFYVMPCLPALLDCLGGSNLSQLPPIPAPVSAEEPGASAEEQSVLVLTHGPECRRLMVEVLDQTAAQELLALKLLPKLPPGHANLVFDCLGARLNTTTAVCCLLLRGLQLQESLQPAVRHANGRILITRSLRGAMRLGSAFFHEAEVFGDSRRRRLHSFLPASFLQNEPPPLAGMGQTLPDISVPFAVTFDHETDRLWIARRLWKSLESDGFHIENACMDRADSLSFVARRSNALFRIADHLRSYLDQVLPSAQLQAAATASELPSETPQLPRITDLPSEGRLLSPEHAMAELALLVISGEGLNAKFRGRPAVHLLLELLSSKKFDLLALRMVSLDESAVRAMKASGEIQVSEAPTPGPALCLLLFGLMARLGMRQLLQSNANISNMTNHIFVPQSSEETARIASGLFSFVVSNPVLALE